MTELTKRVHLYISGRVQGVCYRATTCDKAASLGLTGWVQNLDDGRVEALAEGPVDLIDALVEWCGRGPDMARVDEVRVIEENPTKEFSSFRVLY